LSGVKLKWPNDVLWGGSKLAGILLEMIGDAAGHCQVVIGIGINVSMRPEVAGNSIDQPWTSVNAAAGGTISRNLLLANLLSELLPLLAAFEAGGFAALRDEWSALDAMYGAEVLLHAGDQVVAGRAVGVAASGALAIETSAGCQWFHGGEVSLRLRGDSPV
jgi:BirA family biotin operon repressor/biotin-[acetyl-CoA-carboxylase] ligase